MPLKQTPPGMVTPPGQPIPMPDNYNSGFFFLVWISPTSAQGYFL